MYSNAKKKSTRNYNNFMCKNEKTGSKNITTIYMKANTKKSNKNNGKFLPCKRSERFYAKYYSFSLQVCKTTRLNK